MSGNRALGTDVELAKLLLVVIPCIKGWLRVSPDREVTEEKWICLLAGWEGAQLAGRKATTMQCLELLQPLICTRGGETNQQLAPIRSVLTWCF